MSLAGGNMLVKLYPLDWQPIDYEPDGYRSGPGIFQWRLTGAARIYGALLCRLSPGDSMPWVA
jgi:hypothetical protein